MKLFLIGLFLVFTLFFGNNAFSSNAVVETLIQDNGWGVTAVDPQTNKVYITNFKSDTVTVLDGETDKPISEIKVGNTPYGLGINTETKILYVALERADILAIVNSTTSQIIKEITLSKPYDIAVNSKSNMVYVTSDKEGVVTVLDGSLNEIITTLDVLNPCGIAVNENTNMVYVTSESENKVYVFDGSKNNLIASIDVGSSPRGVVANSNTNMVYVTNQMTGTVSVIDGEKNQVIDSISVGETPRRIVVNPSTNLIYVSNQIPNTLSVIDGATNKVVDSIPVEQPFELMINPKTGKIYSTYFGYSGLSIVNDTMSKDSLENYYGIIVAGIIAGGAALFIVFKRKKHLAKVK